MAVNRVVLDRANSKVTTLLKASRILSNLSTSSNSVNSSVSSSRGNPKGSSSINTSRNGSRSRKRQSIQVVKALTNISNTSSNHNRTRIRRSKSSTVTQRQPRMEKSIISIMREASKTLRSISRSNRRSSRSSLNSLLRTGGSMEARVLGTSIINKRRSINNKINKINNNKVLKTLMSKGRSNLKIGRIHLRKVTL